MKPNGIYIAGASAEIERAEAAIAHAVKLGLEVTYNWTKDIRAHAAQGKTDKDLSDVVLKLHATKDLVGIVEARVFVLLAPQFPSTGCWAELGYALAHGRRVFVSRQRAHRVCVFETLATAQLHSDDATIMLAAFACGMQSDPALEERP